MKKGKQEETAYEKAMGNKSGILIEMVLYGSSHRIIWVLLNTNLNIRKRTES